MRIAEPDISAEIMSGAERRDLDYKCDIDLTTDNKKAKVEIAKDIIAMANSGGGLIVGGVKETEGGFKWEGMPEESLKAFDSTPLNDFVRNQCAPPINCTTRKVEIDGHTYGVIQVPGFVDQPHIVTKDYQQVLNKGDILVRSASNNSVRAEPDDLRRLIDRAVGLRQGVLRDLLQTVFQNTPPSLIGGAPQIANTTELPFDRQVYSDRFKGFRIIRMSPANEELPAFRTRLFGATQAAIVHGVGGYPDFPDIDLAAAIQKRLPAGVALEY